MKNYIYKKVIVYFGSCDRYFEVRGKGEVENPTVAGRSPKGIANLLASMEIKSKQRNILRSSPFPFPRNPIAQQDCIDN